MFNHVKTWIKMAAGSHSSTAVISYVGFKATVAVSLVTSSTASNPPFSQCIANPQQ